MVPIYILGLLMRFGPQHGYQIKKQMKEQMEDFTQIKLPTVYYHLEKMEASGLVSAYADKQGTRPEKKVYTISKDGKDKFKELIKEALKVTYRPNFDMDAAFYFSDYLDNKDLLDSLQQHVIELNHTLTGLEQHRKEMIESIPEDVRVSANIIFEHHIMHYKAELAWAEQSIYNMKEGLHGKDTSN